MLLPLVAHHADEGGDGQHELAGGSGNVRREAEEADHGRHLNDAAADAEGGGNESDAEAHADAEGNIDLHVLRVHVHIIFGRRFPGIFPDDHQRDEEEQQAECGAEGAPGEPVRPHGPQNGAGDGGRREGDGCIEFDLLLLVEGQARGNGIEQNDGERRAGNGRRGPVKHPQEERHEDDAAAGADERAEYGHGKADDDIQECGYKSDPAEQFHMIASHCQ